MGLSRQITDIYTMTSDNKSKILQGIYEENLYHVVRGERRHQVAEAQSDQNAPLRQRTVLVTIFLAVVIIFSSDKGNVALQSVNVVMPIVAFTTTVENSQEKRRKEAHLSQMLSKTVPMLYEPNVETSDDLGIRPPLKLPIYEDTLEDYSRFGKPGFSLAHLFGLGVKTIVIDPGHGGKDPGAIGSNKLQEKEIVLALAQRIKKRLLLRGGYNVFLTRDEDRSMSLQKRVDFANSKSADLFISIHVNAHTEVNGNFIETYYFGTTEDSTVAELAARENAQSDYRYTDFKHMIQHISDTLKFQESKSLASFVQHSLFRSVKKLNNKTANHGIKPGPFVVLLGLEAPSILTEVANLTDKEQEKRLKTARYRDYIAKFLEKGIVNYLNNSTTLGDLK